MGTEPVRMRALTLLAVVCVAWLGRVDGEGFSDAELADLLEGSIHPGHTPHDDTYFGDGLGVNLSPGDAATTVDSAVRSMLQPGAEASEGGAPVPPNFAEMENPAGAQGASLLQPGAPLTRATASAGDGVAVLPAFAPPQQAGDWAPATHDATNPSMDLGEQTPSTKAAAVPKSKVTLTDALKAKHTLELAEQRLGVQGGKEGGDDGVKGGTGGDDEDADDREEDAAEEAAVDKEDAVGKLAQEVKKEDEGGAPTPAPGMNINGNSAAAAANGTGQAMQHLVEGQKVQEMESKVGELEGTVARVDHVVDALVSRMTHKDAPPRADADDDGGDDDGGEGDGDAEGQPSVPHGGYDPDYKAAHLTPESQKMIKDATVESVKLSEKTHGMKEDGNGFRELTEQEKSEFMDDVQDYGKHSVSTLVGTGKIMYRGGDMLFNNKNLTDAERAEFKEEVKDTAKNAAGAFLKGTIISAKTTSYLVGGLYNSINWLEEGERADADGNDGQGGAADSDDSDSDFANTPEEEHLTGGAEPSGDGAGAPDGDGMQAGSSAEPGASGATTDQDSESAGGADDESQSSEGPDGGQSKSASKDEGDGPSHPAAAGDDDVDRDTP